MLEVGRLKLKNKKHAGHKPCKFDTNPQSNVRTLVLIGIVDDWR